MIRIPTHRPPTHPGAMLLHEFLIPMEVTQRYLANAIGVPYYRINALINGRMPMTPAMALRLSKFFTVSAEFWMHLQLRWDLFYSARNDAATLNNISPYSSTSG